MHNTTDKAIMPKIYKAEREREREKLTEEETDGEILNIVSHQENAIQDDDGISFCIRLDGNNFKNLKIPSAEENVEI